MIIKPIKQFNKALEVPSDKSIAQRAVLFSSMSGIPCKIYAKNLCQDAFSAIKCVKELGANVDVDMQEGVVTIKGGTFNSCNLNVENSATAIRLLCGILAGAKAKRFVLYGDSSIARRPMQRVLTPLKSMGASIVSLDGKAPIAIEGRQLQGIGYNSPIPSAQVKSAILLAGLNASGKTSVTEQIKSRDHTERLLQFYGANISNKGLIATVIPSRLVPQNTLIPGDFSSAAFSLVLAAAIKGGRVQINNVGINPTRTGLLAVLKDCGAIFSITNERNEFEPSGTIELEYASLKPFNIGADLVPQIIDELPILAVLACFIEGVSTIEGAGELRYKESNRIDVMVSALKAMGANIQATDSGMIIRGTGSLKGGIDIDTHGDHRIAMSLSIAGALSIEGAIINNAECVNVSYPNFYDIIT